MLNNIKNRKQQGFTIIEVLIVLAIAGLILLVVLLAVPALQRNARNTAIKNDAAALAGGVSEYMSNNDGNQPTAAPQVGASVTFGPNNTAVAKVQGSTAVTVGAAWPATPGAIVIDFKQECGAAAGTVTANPRSTAILYTTEASSGNVKQCVDA